MLHFTETFGLVSKSTHLMPEFSSRTVAIMGLGLISGSLARALKTSAWDGEIIAWGPREPSLKLGLELGAIDDYSLSLSDVVARADMIVVGAPPASTGLILREIVDSLSDTKHAPVLTDLASIKGHVIDTMARDYAGFVPGHPIAGSEHSGVKYADEGLFRGREVILTPLEATDLAAVNEVEALWQLTGAYLSQMAVDQHDALLAASSHMPHMVSYALTRALEKDPSDPMTHGGGALRDMTRIAGSDPLMWTDIALTNREALLLAIDAFEVEVAALRQMVADKDGDLMNDYFSICRRHRREHDHVLNPMTQNDTDSTG